MSIRFLGEAEDEFVEAAAWYEERRRGLGTRFRDAVAFSLRTLEDSPRSGVERHGSRRLPVPGFPFMLVYQAVARNVVIIAVMHTRRRPGYWRRRDIPNAT